MDRAVLRNSLIKSLLGICLLLPFQSSLRAQGPSQPEKSQLLNGLRVMLSPRPGDQEVLIKLRVHSGAAFDLAGKAGSTALLGDLLFPDQNTREYFTDEMQGRLDVKTDYDAITITMQGRAREFERIIEIMRTALVTTQLTPENVAKVRDGRIKVIRETGISPAIVADRAISTRLYGDFPYGRPYAGTVESLERVERSDLMLARDRFLNPNNSTLVVIGGVQPSRALRALRQLLGSWRKSEQIVPATFRQPLLPDTRTLVINSPADQSVEVRLAVRGFARNDPDAMAATLLTGIAKNRWEKALPELSRTPMFVRHDAFALPGMFVLGTSIDHLLAGKALTTAREVVQSLATTPVTPAEFEQARAELVSLMNKELAKPDGAAEVWLDMDTYGLAAATEQLRVLGASTPSDLQRAATRLFRDGGFASVVVGNSELVKTQIERYVKVEIMGTVDPRIEPKPDQKTTKPTPSLGAKPE